MGSTSAALGCRITASGIWQIELPNPQPHESCIRAALKLAKALHVWGLKSMMKTQFSPIALLMASLLIPVAAQAADSQSIPSDEKTRIAIIGLDHDHVWEL